MLICILGFGIFLGTFFHRAAPPPPPQIVNTATVLKQVQTLSELVTVKYVLEKVVILEDPTRVLGVSIPGGENRVWLLAHGIVKAGINFKDIRPDDIQIQQKKITVRMPAAVMTDAYLDDRRTQVLDRSTGVLRTFDKDLEQNARQQARGEILKAARELGILKEAQERAQMQLTDLFHRLGFDQVEFQSGSPSLENTTKR